MEKTVPTDGKDCDKVKSGGFLEKHFSRFIEINKKYAEPQIKMTGMVRVALLGLRIYLIILVLVLAFKFYTLVRP
ncbi:MAG TPA: hypothetical protein VMS89_04485 [Methanoregulaceae archaeon]|nr:hypothetical protein [Methanoregulaceae archaeon]